MDWQPISTAPKDGRFLLLAINPPVDTNDTVGWWLEDQIPVVMGRWDPDSWDATNWKCVFMMEGSADSEGRSSQFPISVRPTHWMPLPAPPSV